jgi:PAS domain S-box-containing protein
MADRIPTALRVLLVEDEAGYAGLVKRTLGDAPDPFDVCWTASLSETLEQLRTKPFDVIILDLSLPDSEGSETVSRIQAVSPDLPILVLSGLTDEDVIYEVLRRGVQEYLIKDTSTTVLLPRAIRYAIDRKRAEQELNESIERLEGLFNGSPDAVFVEDTDGLILDVNPAACRLHDMSYDELVGKNVVDLVPPNERDVVKERFHEWVTGEMENFEGFSSKRTGEAVPVEIRGAKITYKGQPAILLHVRDISERKESEAALAQSRQRFRDLADLIPLPLWETDLDGNFTYTNRSGYETFGYTTADIEKGLHAFTVFARRDRMRVATSFIERLASKTHESEEYTCVTSGGRLFPVLIYSAPIIENGETVGLRGITLDISDRVTLEAQLRQAQKLESLGTLAQGVAHEISNPVMGIIGYADLLKDFFEEDDEATGFINEIIEHARGVSDIVKNLERFSPSEAPATWETLKVDELINNTASLVRPAMVKSGISLSVNIEAGLPPVEGSEQQIQQVLMNLLTNASDALNEKYPEDDSDKVIVITARTVEDLALLPAEMGARIADGAACVRITVEDHGTGMSEHVRERLFDPFFSTKPQDKGTGLGLSINHGIIRDHGGQITVESEEGEFTRFHVDLPASTAD